MPPNDGSITLTQQLDESTLSEAQRQKLQSVRDTYKLDNLLDFEGNKGREVGAHMMRVVDSLLKAAGQPSYQ